MDIGTKLQKARLQARLTQEQVAESLGVSRQTISNWENEKTYPDIISVIKMSDLYAVSLDHLLKEEQPMSNYIDYLEESTNIVNSKNKLSRLLIIITYLVIWAFSLIFYWFFTSGSDAMGYSLIFLWILLPVTTFILSLLIGKGDHWGRYKWISPLIFGLMYMLAEYGTFSAANMVSFDKFNLPSLGMIPAGAIISLLGIGLGTVIRKFRSRQKTNSSTY